MARHHPAVRHRLGEAGAPTGLDPAPGHACRGPASRAGARGPTSRPSRSATGCSAARAPRRPVAPTRCWRWVRPAWTTATSGWWPSTRAPASGRSPRVLPDSPEDVLFRSHGWVLESHDDDTVFELAGVAAARRSLAGVSLPGLDVALAGDDRLVTAEATTDDGRELASGVAAYADDWVGFRSIEVDPAERGRRPRAAGHGRAARMGRRARRDHGVPPGAGRQHAAPSRCTTGSASASTIGTATWRYRYRLADENLTHAEGDGHRSARRTRADRRWLCSRAVLPPTRPRLELLRRTVVAPRCSPRHTGAGRPRPEVERWTNDSTAELPASHPRRTGPTAAFVCTGAASSHRCPSWSCATGPAWRRSWSRTVPSCRPEETPAEVVGTANGRTRARARRHRGHRANDHRSR